MGDNYNLPLTAVVLCVMLCGCSGNRDLTLDSKGYLKLQNISTENAASFEQEKIRVKNRVRRVTSQLRPIRST
jgi:hypothetical protein